MKRLTLTTLLALVATLACVAAPAAARSDRALAKAILEEYIESGGRLNACNFTLAELKKVKAAIPVDNRQYGAAFVAAIDDALAARAQGACDEKKQNATPPAVATQTPPPAAGTTPPPAGSSGATPAAQATPGVPAQAQAPPTPTAEPSPATAVAADNAIALASRMTAAESDPPAPVLLLAIIAGLLALAALAFATIRFFAWEPLWAVRFRHAAGEAGWRASSTFSEFADFVRLGR